MINDELITKSDILLVELKLNGFTPGLFTLMIIGSEKDYVLNDGKNLLFYSDLKRTNEILAVYFKGITFSESDAQKLIQKCYPSEAIQLILDVDNVSNSLVLDTINSLLDFTNSLSVEVPEKFGTVLREFADHMTFETDYKMFFSDKTYQKKDLIDAIYWGVGFLTSHIKVIEAGKL